VEHTTNNTVAAENMNLPQDAQQPPQECSGRTSVTAAQSVFAWVSLLAGYAFCRVFPAASNPLGGLLFMLGLYTVTVAVLMRDGIGRLGAMCLTVGLSGIAVLLGTVLSENGMIREFSYVYSFAAYGYFVYSATGNSLEKGFSGLIIADFLRALFVLPFTSLGRIYVALFGSRRSRSGGKAVAMVLLGFAMAVIPTAVIFALLSYDQGFTDLFDKITGYFSFSTLFSHFFSLLLGVPVAMYIYGLLIASVEKKTSEKTSPERYRSRYRKMNFAPAVTLAAAVLPILLVYVVFFVSQWQYYVSGFEGVLPDDQIYATYAREGFFQLCAVSAINFFIIIALNLFMRRKSDRPPVTLRILSVVLSVFTLVLMSTAMSKLVLYIKAYGLTPKRVHAAWFMAVLAVMFLIVTVKQFVLKIKLLPICASVCVVMFAALALSGSGSAIAKYNVDRYLDGSLKTIDVMALEDLGDEAVPQLIRLAKAYDKKYGTDIRKQINEEFDELPVLGVDSYSYYRTARALRKALERDEDTGVFSVTLPHLRAQRALREAGLTLEE